MDASQGGELVLSTANLHGSDSGTFQRGEEDAAEGVANRVTVTFIKRFCGELGVVIGGGSLVADEAIRHFESC
jgi:hypothetical protein